MSIASVTRELLVRYLDTWAPSALRAARRATFAQAWSGPADVASAEAALRVFAEFSDRLRGRRLAVVLVAPQTAELMRRLDEVQTELGTPPELSVHAVAGDAAALMPVALTAAGATGAPLLAYVDTAGGDTAGGDAAGALPVGAIAGGRPAELMLVTAARGWDDHRRTLHEAGFPLTAGVELVDGDDARLVVFATSFAKHLEAFKDALWAVDEYADVRYRDPRDPDGYLLDISLSPQPGPLRRELLAYLANSTEDRSVTDLRHFTLTETVYRAADTSRALTGLLAAGAVTRSPEHGRLSGDVIISLSAPGNG
jgi:hypothetical protein